MPSKAGSFSAYLAYTQSNREETQGGPLQILRLLGKPANQIMELDQLASRSGLSAVDFRESLKSLVDSKFVELSGPALSEVVKLTDKGADVAKLI